MSNGKIYVNRGKFEFWLGNDKKAGAVAEADALEKELIPAKGMHLYKSDNHQSDWLSCIRSRQQPCTDVEIGARTVSVCHLVNFAYYHGKRLKWNPAREQFAGGTGDAKWLDVPHRAPWNLA